VKAALRALLARLVERPALKRALADVPAERRVDALAEVWLASNAFEHVLCGEVNPEGTVGGMHLWSEYYLAERAGRARYLCSRMGQDDDDVATFHFDWQPERLTTRHVKRIGGFHLGQSPACLLALGYLAIARNCRPSDGVKTAFRSVIYGKPVEWVFWTNERGLITLFPLTHDSPGVRN
jgi:hypothetical protein